MTKWINDPWIIGIVTAILVAILTEVPPLHLFSGYVVPWMKEVLALLLIPIKLPLWIILAVALIYGLLVLFGKYAFTYFCGKSAKLIYGGLLWEPTATAEGGFRPVCDYCFLPLLLRTEEEERLDQNNVPFRIIPDYPNTLVCTNCRKSIHIKEPWNKIVEEAGLFFKSNRAARSKGVHGKQIS